LVVSDMLNSATDIIQTLLDVEEASGDHCESSPANLYHLSLIGRAVDVGRSTPEDCQMAAAHALQLRCSSSMSKEGSEYEQQDGRLL
jgi:hypothetical protein